MAYKLVYEVGTLNTVKLLINAQAFLRTWTLKLRRLIETRRLLEHRLETPEFINVICSKMFPVLLFTLIPNVEISRPTWLAKVYCWGSYDVTVRLII